MTWAGHGAGETVEAVYGYDYAALVWAGTLEVLELEPVYCPACSDDPAVKRVPKFSEQGEFEEHYASKHPALSPPDLAEVVTDAGQ